MAMWHLVREIPPPTYKTILLAFEEHWNVVAGFKGGKSFWETSAHDHNSEIKGEPPKWWAECPEVPHRPAKNTPEAQS